MGNVIRFVAHGKTYDLSVRDKEGRKWVPSQQLGEAIGAKNMRRVIRNDRETGELKEGKHCRTLTVRRADGKLSQQLVLSYRGVIRVAMKARGPRATLFRDWAEEVLFQVMMTGQYRARQEDPPDLHEVFALGRRQGFTQGLAISDSVQDIPRQVIAKATYFRRLGLTQKETARACGLTRSKLQAIEQRLREVGVKFDPVNVNKRDKQIVDGLVDTLMPPCTSNRQLALVKGHCEEGGAL